MTVLLVPIRIRNTGGVIVIENAKARDRRMWFAFRVRKRAKVKVQVRFRVEGKS